MKIIAISIALLALLPSAPGATSDTDTFIDHFHDDANVTACVTLIDQLIDAGEARIYASMENEKMDRPLPHVKTPSGILMLYSVAHTPDGVLVHFSTSRPPYLPSAFGKHLVGLFMARSGWPKPAMFSISDHQVIHAIWIVPEAQFAQIQATLPDLRAKIRKSESAKDAFLRGLLRAGDLESISQPPPKPPPPPAHPAGDHS